MKTHIQGDQGATLCGRKGPSIQSVPAARAADADCALCVRFAGKAAAPAKKKAAASAVKKAVAPAKKRAATSSKKATTNGKAAAPKRAKSSSAKSAATLSEARIREIVREELAAQGSPFDLLSTHDAAELLGVGRRKVEKWVKAGKLAAVDLSQKQIRIAREAVDALLEKRAK